MDKREINLIPIETEEIDKAIESLIAVSDKPVFPEILWELIKDTKFNGSGISKAGLEAELRNSILRLNTAYETIGTSFRIEKIAGGYKMMTLSKYDHFIRRYLHPPKYQRLSRAALETLAIIAYRQPVVRSEIERIRGVAVDGVLRTLLDRKLVKISGRADKPGRPLLYSTDTPFLEYFGLNDISELPDEKEIETLIGKPSQDFNRNITIKRSAEADFPPQNLSAESDQMTEVPSDEIGDKDNDRDESEFNLVPETEK